LTGDARHELEGSRCLVTGGAGLIGSHVVEELLRAGAAEVIVYDSLVRGSAAQVDRVRGEANVRLIQGDIRDFELLRRTTEHVDYVFHQAAMWLRECQAHPRRSLEVNVVGTYNVLETAVEAGVRKVVAASSASVYGEGLYLPVDESHAFNNDFFYGATKVAGEQLMRSFYAGHGLEYVALRYFNVYGPHQASSAAYMDVITHFADRIEAGEPPRIEGDGSETLDMVYVSDAARANVLALTSSVTGDAFNVASGLETTVAELAGIMLRLYGRTDLEPTFVPRDRKLVSRRCGSPDKARELLGFEVTVDVEEGLSRLIEGRAGQPAN
jgi:nucleoside-diphosphate-sugar epimerase